MFREFIQYALGPIGRQVLEFYSDYNLIINFFVFGYGLVMFYPHFVLANLIKRVDTMILEISAKHQADLNIDRIYQELTSTWINQHSRKTIYLPTKNDLWYEKFMEHEILDVLNINRDYTRMALHKLSGNPPMRDFQLIDFKIWEKYRLLLKKGIRGKTPQEIYEIRKKGNA